MAATSPALTPSSTAAGGGRSNCSPAPAWRVSKLAAAKPYTYSDHEVDNLTRAAVAWGMMHHEMDLAVGRLNTKFGVELADNIEKIVRALVGPATTSLWMVSHDRYS